MKTSPFVSVIMPAYNHEKFVGEAVESVLGQSFGDFEFIILNDGSTDNTEEIIKTYSDKRIRYFSHPNMDAPNTINKGISLANGRYISIINSDDIYHKDRLANVLNEIENTDVVFVTTGMDAIDGDSNILDDPWYRNLLEFHLSHLSFELTLLQGNIARTTSNFFLLADAARELGNFRSFRYVHDYDYILRALVKFKDRVKFLHKENLLSYRIHGSNTVAEAPPKVREECFAVFLEILPNLMTDNSDSEKIAILCKRFSAFNEEIYTYYRKQIALKSDAIDNLNKAIAEIHESRSWKITAFLRATLELVQNKNKKSNNK